MKLEIKEKTTHLSEHDTMLLDKLDHVLWISKQSHPDIAFDITDLADRINTRTVEDLKDYMFLQMHHLEICMTVATKVDIL